MRVHMIAHSQAKSQIFLKGARVSGKTSDTCAGNKSFHYLELNADVVMPVGVNNSAAKK